jgi:hypothetical protein
MKKLSIKLILVFFSFASQTAFSQGTVIGHRDANNLPILDINVSFFNSTVQNELTQQGLTLLSISNLELSDQHNNPNYKKNLTLQVSFLDNNQVQYNTALYFHVSFNSATNQYWPIRFTTILYPKRRVRWKWRWCSLGSNCKCISGHYCYTLIMKKLALIFLVELMTLNAFSQSKYISLNDVLSHYQSIYSLDIRVNSTVFNYYSNKFNSDTYFVRVNRNIGTTNVYDMDHFIYHPTYSASKFSKNDSMTYQYAFKEKKMYYLDMDYFHMQTECQQIRGIDFHPAINPFSTCFYLMQYRKNAKAKIKREGKCKPFEIIDPEFKLKQLVWINPINMRVDSIYIYNKDYSKDWTFEEKDIFSYSDTKNQNDEFRVLDSIYNNFKIIVTDSQSKDLEFDDDSLITNELRLFYLNHKVKKPFLLIDFYFNSCAPCRIWMQHLNSLAIDSYPIEIIGINPIDDKESFSFFKNKMSFNFSLEQDYSKLNSLLNVPSYPFTLIIDREGKIVYNSAQNSEIKGIDLFKIFLKTLPID